MKKVIHLLCGVPGCGKTTWAKKQIGANTRVLSRDDVRDQLRRNYGSTEYFPVPKEVEYKAWIFACASTIIAHPEVDDFYFDQTSVSKGAILKFFKYLAETYGDLDCFQFEIDIFDVPLDICKKRNNQRVGFAKVPDKVIDKMQFAINILNFREIKAELGCDFLRIKTIDANGETVSERWLG